MLGFLPNRTRNQLFKRPKIPNFRRQAGGDDVAEGRGRAGVRRPHGRAEGHVQVWFVYFYLFIFVCLLLCVYFYLYRVEMDAQSETFAADKKKMQVLENSLQVNCSQN